MPVFTATLLALLFVDGKALRQKRASQPGMVEYLYTTGSPGLTIPALTNFSGCLRGKRVVHVRTKGWGLSQNDLIPGIGRVLGFKNPMIDLRELDVKTYKIKNTACSREATKKPSNWPDYGLHDRKSYFNSISNAKVSDFEKSLGYFATILAFEKDEKSAKNMTESKGWKLVASAEHEGGKIFGAPQIVHLIQHPSTFECVVTFQGLQEIKGWLSAGRVLTTNFCGRPEKFHKGMAWLTELSVTSDEFQAKIRPNLPKCSRVIAAGQSAGGAQADFFTACVNQSPPPDNDMYNAMSWEKGTPAALPYL